MPTKKMKVSELVFDYDLYPRGQVSSTDVSMMIEARKSGKNFPPILVDRRSKRIIDGFHRAKMEMRLHGADATITVQLKQYPNEAAMYRDAMRLNAEHGRKLSTWDRLHALGRATELGIDIDEVADDLNMTVEALGKLRTERIGELRTAGAKPEDVPLKRTLRHLGGKELTARQVAANRRLSGMNQAFYANQLIELIECGGLNTADDSLMERLSILRRLLDGLLARTG